MKIVKAIAVAVVMAAAAVRAAPQVVYRHASWSSVVLDTDGPVPYPREIVDTSCASARDLQAVREDVKRLSAEHADLQFQVMYLRAHVGELQDWVVKLRVDDIAKARPAES